MQTINSGQAPLPVSILAEQALLGAILMNNEALPLAIDRAGIKPDDFSEDLHTYLFDLMQRMIGEGTRVTPIILNPYVQNLGVPNGAEITVVQYLARLATAATTVLNAPDFALSIVDLANRRRLIDASNRMDDNARHPENGVLISQVMADAENDMAEIEERSRTSNRAGMSLGEAFEQSVEMIEQAVRSGNGISGISSGFASIDDKMGGFQRSDLIVLAGRPAMGKTALATNIAYKISSTWQGQQESDGSVKTVSGGKVLFFSLEMSAEQLATRMLAEQTHIPSNVMRRGKVNDADFDRIVDMKKTFAAMKMIIDDTGGLSVNELCSRARRHARAGRVEMIIIDYLQLLSSGDGRHRHRVAEITEITTKLKALAKELKVPVLLLSQLNRAVDNRVIHRPVLSDLRESGSIEQDADVVLFVYREEYYLNNEKPDEGTAEYMDWESKMLRAEGKAEVIIGKQRHGPTGTIMMKFEGVFTAFSDLPEHAQNREGAEL